MTEARRRQGPWLGNLAPCTLGQLEAIVRNRLQRIQRQPALINRQRDKHLRSADFFHVDEHPQAVLTVTSARVVGPAELECQGTFEAAGHVRPVAFTAHIQEATAQAATLTAELELERTEFDMTWSPLHIASTTAHGTVKARFVRA